MEDGRRGQLVCVALCGEGQAYHESCRAHGMSRQLRSASESCMHPSAGPQNLICQVCHKTKEPHPLLKRCCWEQTRFSQSPGTDLCDTGGMSSSGTTCARGNIACPCTLSCELRASIAPFLIDDFWHAMIMLKHKFWILSAGLWTKGSTQTSLEDRQQPKRPAVFDHGVGCCAPLDSRFCLPREPTCRAEKLPYAYGV